MMTLIDLLARCVVISTSIAACILGGCSTSSKLPPDGHLGYGHDFPISPFATFQLGTTTPAMVQAAIGVRPLLSVTGTEQWSKELGKPVVPAHRDTLSWVWSYSPPQPHEATSFWHPECVARKEANVSFANGHLVSYSVISGVPGDTLTKFDADKLKSLKVGVTDRVHAIALLGSPSLQVPFTTHWSGMPGRIEYYTPTPGNELTSRFRQITLLFDVHNILSEPPRNIPYIDYGLWLCPFSQPVE